jgi:hypothetical protein
LNSAYSVSYGIGKEIHLNKRLSINTELSGQCYYIGHWDYVPLSAKIQACLTYKINKQLELFAGPTYTFTETKNTITSSGYMSWLQDRNVQYKQIGNTVSSWISYSDFHTARNWNPRTDWFAGGEQIFAESFGGLYRRCKWLRNGLLVQYQ